MRLPSHAVDIGDISHTHLAVLECVRDMMSRMPSVNEDKSPLSCHQVCEEAARTMPNTFRHVRGYFRARAWQHSWLTFLDEPKVIIDAYPWASASGPLLITLATGSPWVGVYVENQTGPLNPGS